MGRVLLWVVSVYRRGLLWACEAVLLLPSIGAQLLPAVQLLMHILSPATWLTFTVCV